METFMGACLVIGIGLITSSLMQRRQRHLHALEKRLGLLNANSANQVNRVFAILRPVLVGRWLNPWGRNVEVEKQLKFAGINQSLSEFRQSQIVFMFWSLVVITTWEILRLLAHQPLSVGLVLALYLTSVPLSGYLRFALLKDQAKKRASQINQEIAAMFDLVAFSISAGDPVISAIGRVGKVCSSPSALIFQQISDDIAKGASINFALSQAEQMTSATSFARSLRAIKTSIERGTPISAVLRAQAGDARSNSSADLMKLAGKKESLMMVPVVFLILPMIVFIALYPGLSALQIA